MLTERLTAIRTALEQLRPQVRPEGDQAYGALDVAIAQAQDEAAAEPAPALPEDQVLGYVTEIHADVRALRDHAGV